MLMIPDNIEIDAPLQKGLTCYLEGSRFEFNSKGCFLLITRPLITKDAVQSFYDRNVEFSIGVYDDIIFFWTRIRGLSGWSYSPYSYHLVDSTSRPSLEDTRESGSLKVKMILVDANIGIVRGIREVLFPPELSTKLLGETRKQSKRDFDQNRYYISLGRIDSILSKRTEARGDAYNNHHLNERTS